MRTPRVLLITDAAFSDDTMLRAIEAAARALPPGDLAVQLREKARDRRVVWAQRLRAVTRELGVVLVVNGDVPLARAVEADGMHFGREATAAAVAEGAGLWRSVVAHDDEDVVRACGQGVNAVLVSPIFASPGKGAPRGVSALERAVTLAKGRVAVIALGGVGPENAPTCFEAGADGVAVIRALLGAAAPGEVARALAGVAGA